jgi:hypothetical protein
MRHALLMMSDSRTLSKTAWLLSRRLTFEDGLYKRMNGGQKIYGGLLEIGGLV